MKGLPLITSLGLNILLVLTIANIYASDQYFRDWVSVTINPLSPFLILTLAVGGGSGLGYLFLQRKHPNERVSSKLAKPRLVGRPILPTGPKVLPPATTPGSIPKQIAYAVPPPAPTSRSSPSMSKQIAPGLSISKLSQPNPMLQQQPQTFQSRKEPVPQQNAPVAPPNKPDFPAPSPNKMIPHQVRTGPAPWQQDQRPQFAGKPDSQLRPPQTPPGPNTNPNIFATSPSTGQMTSRPLPIPSLPPSSSTTGPSGIPVPQKWQPPVQSGQTVSSGPGQTRPDIDPSQKWTPIPNRQFGQPSSAIPPPTSIQQQSPSMRQASTFPAASPQQPRPFPPTQSQPPPNPFTARPLPPQGPRPAGTSPYQQGSPGFPPRQELGPVAVPRQFRPEQDRTNIPGQQPMRLPLTPQPWSPSTPPQSSSLPKARQPDIVPPTVFPKPSQTEQSPQSQRAAESQQKPTEQHGQGEVGTAPSEPSATGGGSDMDWDTALDTILKTLRRDRIRDEQ